MTSMTDLVWRIVMKLKSSPIRPERCRRLITCIRYDDANCCRDIEAGQRVVDRVQAERVLWSI